MVNNQVSQTLVVGRASFFLGGVVLARIALTSIENCLLLGVVFRKCINFPHTLGVLPHPGFQ